MTGTASWRRYELGRVMADLVVLTVLREEYEAVLGCLAAPGLLLGSEGAPNTYAWQLGAIDSPRYGATFRVVVGMGTPTTTYGALAAMQAIRLFDPRYIVFVGVAGGFDRDGQRHGDVAVSSAVVAYEYGKVDTGGFAPRGDFTYRCDDGLVRAAEAVAGTRWWREGDDNGEPRVRTGMIASGDKLIDDPNEAFFAAVAKMWPRLLAVEMEGAGVSAAVHEAQSQRHRAGFVLVRGISDIPHAKAAGEGASTGERDRWKRTAALNAARFLTHLVAEAWPERPRSEVRAPSDWNPEPTGEIGSVSEGTGPGVGGVMVNPVTGQIAPARWEPAHANEENSALSQWLQDAYGRRKRLLNAGAATDAVDREILELKRQLREGGRLRAGDSLGQGRYVLVEELGRGGFAIVWKAKDEVEKCRVAIKILHANLAGDATRRERFYRGARAMRRLQHTGVVRVLDPEGEDGGFCYFVMELIPNGNLHDAVVRKRAPAGSALGHILRVGEALAEAHSQGMIHRDVKPQNILLDEGFEAKLTDFDLVGDKDTTGGTRTGAMGTVIYAAPECLEKPQAATERADVYGLGMTAIFCLAGKALTLSTLRNPEPTIAELDCSLAVKEVLRRSVSWEPEARYTDAGAMVSALRAAMSTDLGAKVANGDAGSGAEAGGAVPSGMVSAIPSATSIMSPLLVAPIAPGAPIPLSPSAPSAGALPVESQLSGGGPQLGEAARSARRTSRADDTQNATWVAVEAPAKERRSDDPVEDEQGMREAGSRGEVVTPQPRVRKRGIFFGVIGSIVVAVVASVAVVFARYAGVEKPPSDAAGPPDVLTVVPPDARVTTFTQDAAQVEVQLTEENKALDEKRGQDATLRDAAIPEVAVSDATRDIKIPDAAVSNAVRNSKIPDVVVPDTVIIKPASVFVLTKDALLGKWTVRRRESSCTSYGIAYYIIDIQGIDPTNKQCHGVYTEDDIYGKPPEQCHHCESTLEECNVETTSSADGSVITELTITANTSRGSPCNNNGFKLTLQSKSLTKATIILITGNADDITAYATKN